MLDDERLNKRAAETENQGIARKVDNDSKSDSNHSNENSSGNDSEKKRSSLAEGDKGEKSSGVKGDAKGEMFDIDPDNNLNKRAGDKNNLLGDKKGGTQKGSAKDLAEDGAKEGTEKTAKKGSNVVEDMAERKKGAMEKMAKTASAASSAGTGAHIASTAAMLIALKEMLFAMMANVAAAVSNFWTAAVNFLVGVGKFMLGANLALGIAGFAISGGIFVIAAVAVIAVPIAIGAQVVRQENQVRQESTLPINCAEHVANFEREGIVNIGSEGVAQDIYSILYTYGMSDEQIAGVLGNFDSESSITPNKIESDYVSRVKTVINKHDVYNVNNMSKQALDELREAVIRSYDGSGINLHLPTYYAGTPGMGLGQLTGSRGLVMLQYANNANVNWGTVEIQMAHMLADPAKGGDSRSPWIRDTYTQTAFASPEEAAVEWAHKWEGNTKLAQQERQNNAKKWYTQMASWEADTDYGQDVISKAEVLQVESTDMAASMAKAKCAGSKTFDNSSAAAAAVSYAFPTEDEGRNNNGTALYQEVKTGIYELGDVDGQKGGPYEWMSCDRSVATAIKWSGTDDSFPWGSTAEQYQYCLTSDKWQEVGDCNTDYLHALQPGDIVIVPRVGEKAGHIVMYVGTELIWKIHEDELASKYPNGLPENYVTVSGSLGKRSPGCGTNITIPKMKESPAKVFRCVQKEGDPKFTSVAGGVKN